MIDLIDRACEWLYQNGVKASKKRLDAFTGKEGVVLRPVATTVRSVYYDGSKDGTFEFQAFARKRSEREAMELCAEVADLLDGARLESANGSFLMTGCVEVSVEPQELKQDDSSTYVWQARFSAQIAF